MTPTEGTFTPLFMVLIACIFLVALDKVDTVLEYYKRASIKKRLTLYAMVIILLQIICITLVGVVYVK